MEMSFQKAVLMIAVVFLILFLVLIGVALNNSTSDTEWPPIVGNCPDYWVDLSGNGSMCFNSHHLGTCSQYIPTADDKKTMDFNQSPFNGTDGACAKYKWATKCGLTWDGITYGVSNPCATTTTDETSTTI
jgi:hypothetical protein